MLDSYVALNRRTPHPPSHVTLDLTRFQRILLGTDGTVTDILEAFAGEPMEVVKLRQAFDTPNEGDTDLVLDGERVLRRRVLLRGRRTRQSLLYAEAVVVVNRVHPGIVDGLVETDKAIGVLLAHHRTETFREILHIDRRRAGDLAAHFGMDPSDEMLSRAYLVISGGRPVIHIVETFPAAFFRGLPA